MLAQSCPSEQLQQLYDTVRQGLVLVNGHSFLISQEWQAEVSAMLARAEQLKVVLAHKQAHHLALLASVLQHLHQQEVQAYDQPARATSSSSSPNWRPHSGMSAVQHGVGQSLGGAAQQQATQQQVVAAGLAAVMQQQQQAAAVLQTDFNSMCLNTSAGLDDDNSDDEFFMPVSVAPCVFDQLSTACCALNMRVLSLSLQPTLACIAWHRQYVGSAPVDHNVMLGTDDTAFVTNCRRLHPWQFQHQGVLMAAPAQQQQQRKQAAAGSPLTETALHGRQAAAAAACWSMCTTAWHLPEQQQPQLVPTRRLRLPCSTCSCCTAWSSS
jgi:hypothetical protein